MTTKITNITCIRPATGIDRVGTTIGEVLTALGATGAVVTAATAGGIVVAAGATATATATATAAAAATGAAAAVATGAVAAAASPLVVILGGVAAVVAGISAVTGAATGIPNIIDSDRSPDDLYVKVNSTRVWPADEKYKDMKGGQSESVSIDCPMVDGCCNIELMEWDILSDDSLGTFDVFEKWAPGVYTVPVDCQAEDSVYLVEITVT